MKKLYHPALFSSVVLSMLLFLPAAVFYSCGEGSSSGGGAVTPAVGAPVGTVTDGVYYVSPSGSDANPGTKERPFKTPGFASRRLIPGDTLVIGEGTYLLSTYDDDIITPPSGTKDAPIVIRGEGTKRPVLEAGDDLLCAVNLSNTSYVTVEHLEITTKRGSTARDGIAAVDGPADHLVLSDLSIHHLDEFGINIGDTDGLKIVDCDVSYCGFGSIGGPAGNAGGWRNVLLSGCRLAYDGHYYQGGPGPSPYDRPDGFGIERSEGPVEIKNCVSEHNRGDGLDSKAKRTYIHECIVANNSCDAVKLWGIGSRVENTLIYGRGDGDMSPTTWGAVVIETDDPNGIFELVNCTVDDYAGNNYVMYAQYDRPTVPTTVEMRNCIFSSRGQNAPIFIGDSTKLVAENNLFFFPRCEDVLVHADRRSFASSDVGGLGPNNRYGDPLFVRPAFGTDGDYRLSPTSPAVDRGTASGAPSIDLDGKPRPAGGGVDIGAYER
jgi:hypothetical protein